MCNNKQFKDNAINHVNGNALHDIVLLCQRNFSKQAITNFDKKLNN